MTASKVELRPLVYDVIPDGHRANYVRLIAGLVGGEPLVAPAAEVWNRLTATAALILPTFETSPALFARLAIQRALKGLPTAIIMMRMHGQAGNRPLMRAGRAAALHCMATLPPIQMLSITPVPEALKSSRLGRRIIEIADPEFWDVPAAIRANPPQTPISDAAKRAANGRASLLVIGTIGENKGLDLLAAIQSAGGPDFARRIAIVCAGKAPDPLHPSVRPILENADFVHSEFLTDMEIYSLYGAADLVWCCYRPDYDMSSGIYGRARQFACPVVVRRGSMLDDFAARDAAGVAIPYHQPITDNDAHEGARLLIELVGRPRPAPAPDDDSVELATLLRSHLGA